MNSDLKFNYDDALKRHNLSQSQIDVLRESAKIFPIVPKSITNKQLCLFVNACDGDIDKATQMLIKHYEIRKKAPPLFTKRDSKLKEIIQCFDNQFYVNLQTPTPGGHLVCLFGLRNTTAKNYVYDTSTRCFLMMIEAAVYKYGTSNGLVLFFDMKNFVAGHLLRNNLRMMKKFFAYVQEGMPIRIHEVHILNTAKVFQLVMALITPFMSVELRQKMYLHSSTFDVEKFTTEHVPRSHLPSDFGGIGESVEVLHAKMYEDFLEMRDFFETEEKQAAMEFD